MRTRIKNVGQSLIQLLRSILAAPVKLLRLVFSLPVVKAYIEGIWINRDSDAVKAGFHEEFTMYYLADGELKVFVTAFHDPSCRPSTVFYALLSHEEYHRY